MVCGPRDSRQLRSDAFAFSRCGQLTAEFARDREAVVEAGKNGERGNGVNQHAVHFGPMFVRIRRGVDNGKNENNLEKRRQFSIEAWLKPKMNCDLNNFSCHKPPPNIMCQRDNW